MLINTPVYMFSIDMRQINIFVQHFRIFDSNTNVCTPICWLIICQYVYTTMLMKYADNCASTCLHNPVHCGWYNSASTLWWCQAVIKYVNTSRGPSAFGRSTKLNDNAIIWSKLLLGVDNQGAEWCDNNKGIRDAGSTADIRMLWPWSALVCLGLL